MAPRIADDQQTRLSMGTPMKSSAGSALQSLMSKGAKSNSPSPSGSPKMQGGETGNRPKVATDQKTVVSSATQLKATSKAGALLSSLVTSPKADPPCPPGRPGEVVQLGQAKAAPKEAESARPTHSDRALEEAEAKVPLLGSGDGAVGLVASTQERSKRTGSHSIVAYILLRHVETLSNALLVKPKIVSSLFTKDKQQNQCRSTRLHPPNGLQVKVWKLRIQIAPALFLWLAPFVFCSLWL
eukprot:g32609.t1